MKRTRTLFALLLAFAMVLAMSAVSFADTPTSQTIDSGSAPNDQGKYTISVASDDTHTYTVYQILTGTLVAGESKLGNPAWGADTVGTGDLNAFIESITEEGLTNTQINDLVKAQLKADATGQGTVSADSPLDVAPGYYLLVDTTEKLEEGDARSLNIVAVFNDITIAPKKGTVESEKHVDDVNDSDATDFSYLKDSADYDIGDSIPYTLTVTLPDDYANYKQYYLRFIDEMSYGLTYNEDAKIYFGDDEDGEDIDFDYNEDGEFGAIYEYEISNLKDPAYANYNLGAGSVITIKYTATLNEDAEIGEEGNPNSYHVEYSNNPNQEAGGTPETGETPEDVNIVFTYKTVFNKVDGEGNPLTGADFTLYKKVVDETAEDGFRWVDVTKLNGENKTNPSKTMAEFTNDKGTAENAKFTFSGLDAGDYKLVESATPTGYNTIADITFTITATHDLVSDNPKLTALTGTDGAEFTMTPSIPDGSLSADIKNNQGAELPSTGGIGTMIFYVLGSLLVVGCGIVLVSRRRMENR